MLTKIKTIIKKILKLVQEVSFLFSLNWSTKMNKLKLIDILELKLNKNQIQNIKKTITKIAHFFGNSYTLVWYCYNNVACVNGCKAHRLAACSIVSPGWTFPPNPFHLPAPKPLFFMPNNTRPGCTTSTRVSSLLVNITLYMK